MADPRLRAPSHVPVEPDASDASCRDYLVFRLSTETYGIDIGAIGEILRLPPVTPVPRAPTSVMGIVSVRGRMLTIVDVRDRLRLDRSPPSRHARILVLPAAHRDEVGLYVDAVMQVVRLSHHEIESPAVVGTEGSEHIIGLGRRAGDIIVLINIEALLSS